jgi:phosphoribosylformylglycinamidine synthase
VTLAEMCLAGQMGAVISLGNMPVEHADSLPDHVQLFSESLCRFVVEVRPEDAPAFEALCADIPLARIGQVNPNPHFIVSGSSGEQLLSLDVAELEQAWRGTEHAATEPHPPTPAPQPPIPAPAPATTPPRVLILHATGTNRDREAALACEVAGGQPEIVHVNQLLSGERRLLDYHMLVLPGGFSYGDDLGAGTLWALDLQHRLGADVTRFVESGRPVLGICNGFQVLVKAGLLPGLHSGSGAADGQQGVTLAPNASSHFECRWVYLQPHADSPCLFTQGLEEPVYCPVAHGEGRLVAASEATLHTLRENRLIALTYVQGDGSPADYPANPNGSLLGIAGLCNPAGNVLGLMPHPEDHIFNWQHPRWQRGERQMTGLRLFTNGLKSVK